MKIKILNKNELPTCIKFINYKDLMKKNLFSFSLSKTVKLTYSTKINLNKFEKIYKQSTSIVGAFKFSGSYYILWADLTSNLISFYYKNKDWTNSLKEYMLKYYEN